MMLCKAGDSPLRAAARASLAHLAVMSVLAVSEKSPQKGVSKVAHWMRRGIQEMRPSMPKQTIAQMRASHHMRHSLMTVRKVFRLAASPSSSVGSSATSLLACTADASLDFLQ